MKSWLLRSKKVLALKRGFTLVELLIVMGILVALLAIVLIALNPVRQFKQAHDTSRSNDVNAILNAVHQYAADNKGVLPSGITSTPQNVRKTGGVDLCATLVPTYLAQLPVDPTVGTNGTTTGSPVSDTQCADAYNTAYQISATSSNRVTVTGTAEIPGVVISVTR
ncbi:type II secretion system protein [Candidatus Woesebacteria bacterium]|nr:type II secretion system protein [Candidatus Woesebacteria bacterium]